MLKHILLFLLLPVLLFSQEFTVDRPGFGTGAGLVAKKSFQIESGFELTKAGDLTENTLPNLLVRYGLARNFEIRLGGTGWTRSNVNSTSNTYRNDALVEAKIKLTRESAPADVAVILGSTIPIGDNEIASSDVEYGFRLVGAWDVTQTIGFGFNIGAYLAESGNERPVNTILSMAFDKGLSDKTGVFFELYGEAPEHETWSPIFDMGLTYLVSPNTQLDAYIGLGLNSTAPDAVVGVGFSHLF